MCDTPSKEKADWNKRFWEFKEKMLNYLTGKTNQEKQVSNYQDKYQEINKNTKG